MTVLLSCSNLQNFLPSHVYAMIRNVIPYLDFSNAQKSDLLTERTPEHGRSVKPSRSSTARLIVLSLLLTTTAILPLNGKTLARTIWRPVIYTVFRLHAIEVQTGVAVRQSVLTALVVDVRTESTATAAHPLMRCQVLKMRGLGVIARWRVVLASTRAIVVVGAVERGVGWGSRVGLVGWLAAWWHGVVEISMVVS